MYVIFINFAYFIGIHVSNLKKIESKYIILAICKYHYFAMSFLIWYTPLFCKPNTLIVLLISPYFARDAGLISSELALICTKNQFYSLLYISFFTKLNYLSIVMISTLIDILISNKIVENITVLFYFVGIFCNRYRYNFI